MVVAQRVTAGLSKPGYGSGSVCRPGRCDWNVYSGTIRRSLRSIRRCFASESRCDIVFFLPQMLDYRPKVLIIKY